MPKKGTNGERPGRAATSRERGPCQKRNAEGQQCERLTGHPDRCRFPCLCGDDVHSACPLHRTPEEIERRKAEVLRRRDTAPPSQGSFKWLPSCPVMGCYRLRIRSGETVNDYDVEPDAEGWRMYYLAIVWTTDLDGRRIRSARMKDYLVRTKGRTWTCSCPDFAHRSRDGGCKHARALRAALASLPF
jgi:hypothetical protein